MNQEYILKKEIDWSSLRSGIAIPSSLRNIFYNSLATNLNMGESKKIKVIINGQTFTVSLNNNKFDRTKYPNNQEMLQIRYHEGSEILKYLHSYFETSYLYLKDKKEKADNKRKQFKLPDELKEYIYIYSTNEPDTLIFDCVSCHEVANEFEAVKELDELDLENLLNKHDTTAHIEKKIKMSKIRHLDVTISNKLKTVYNYSCQVCGKKIGEKYSTDFIHAHHIQPFSTSLNNNPDNIMILCPNHHGIVHVAKPIFCSEKKLFLYPNGFVEGLILNLHL